MRRHGRITAAIRFAESTVLLAVSLTPAHADSAFALNIFNEDIPPGQLILMVALLAAVAFALVSAIFLIRMRNRLEVENRRLKVEVGGLKARVERADALLDEEDQRIIAWSSPNDEPLVAGALPAAAGVPAEPAAFLAFRDWIRTDSATRLDNATRRLRGRGEPFDLTVATKADRLIEVRGRTVGGSAVVRFRDLSGDRLARARVEARHDRAAADAAALRGLLGGTPMPIWLRDDDGTIIWVNDAYAAAVEANDVDDAVARGLELIDTDGRRALLDAHGSSAIASQRLPVVVAGARRIFDVTDIVTQLGSAAIAVDVTDIDTANAALRREIDFLLERDAYNRFLARGPRFRLDAEMIRDNALSISGLINKQIGGKSVYPYQPPGLWEAIGFGDSFTSQSYKQTHGPDLYRRGLYTYWKRSLHYPAFATFDAPNREICTSTRARTTTPLQSLVLLNDPTYVEAARALGQRVMTNCKDRPLTDQLTYAFRLTLSRKPTKDELTILERLYHDQYENYKSKADAAKDLLSVGESKVADELDKAQLAAWTALSNVLLNLDETITKI